MPTTDSAKKRQRQDTVRAERNKARKSALWTWEKSFRKKVSEKDFDGARECLKKTVSLYDKAAKVGIIHANRADRKKARLAKFLKEAMQA